MADIILVDDHAEVLEIAARLLELYGHKVRACLDAETALQSLDQHSPDAVITDDRLPGMSGLDLLKAMRKRVEFADVPVIVLSADPTRREAYERAGAVEYWVKGSDWTVEKMANLGSRLTSYRARKSKPVGNAAGVAAK